MIDKVRVERILADVREAERLRERRDWNPAMITGGELSARSAAFNAQAKKLQRSFPLDVQAQLLTDYLALRAIVEALAKRQPITVSTPGVYYCTLCGAEWSSAEMPTLETHDENCPYRMAVEAIGSDDDDH